MIIEPKVRGFICTTAHPTGLAAAVQEDVARVRKASFPPGPKRVLVIGSSMGYGLATRIAAAFGHGAGTFGVFFEKPAEGKRTASAGWYNTAAFTSLAREAGLYAGNANGDAFSCEVKEEVLRRVHDELGPLDLVVYSLASPRRTHPDTGEKFQSVLKTIGRPYTSKTVDVGRGVVSQVTVEEANAQEMEHTVAVMGGEDWALWIRALREAGLLARGVRTLAYSYLGPELTQPIYRQGTIGRAKDDLERTAHRLTDELSSLDGRALVSINKAVVTQSSSAIPVVPLYITLLFRVMKAKGVHEGAIEQACRLFTERLGPSPAIPTDPEGRIRLDEFEMREDVQSEVGRLWETVSTENLESVADIGGYRSDFLRLFGFGVAGVDYQAEVDPEVEIAGI